jgi:hypothetical protein
MGNGDIAPSFLNSAADEGLKLMDAGGNRLGKRAE